MSLSPEHNRESQCVYRGFFFKNRQCGDAETAGPTRGADVQRGQSLFLRLLGFSFGRAGTSA